MKRRGAIIAMWFITILGLWGVISGRMFIRGTSALMNPTEARATSAVIVALGLVCLWILRKKNDEA